MTPQSSAAFALWLGLGVAGVLAAGCAGGGSTQPAISPTPSPVPSPTQSPSSSAIVSGGRFVASGSHGVTFTFAVGPGVPNGETGLVSALPTVPPCVGTGCTAVQPPADGFDISVGPQPLAVATLTSVALAGVQSSFAVSMILQDTTDSGAFTNFALLAPTGGAIRVIDPASVRPVLTLAPNHVYAIAIYTTGLPPP